MSPTGAAAQKTKERKNEAFPVCGDTIDHLVPWYQRSSSPTGPLPKSMTGRVFFTVVRMDEWTDGRTDGPMYRNYTCDLQDIVPFEQVGETAGTPNKTFVFFISRRPESW